MPPHFITIGEALVEIMRPTADQPLDQPGGFDGPFASGAPAIFAVAAARLGLSTGMITGVGDDAFGWLLRSRLDREGVDTSQLQIKAGHTTGIAFVAYANDGSREFVFHLRQSAAGVLDTALVDPDYFSEVAWLHLSGSALALSKASQTACHRAWSLARAAGGRVSFDPNIRPELMPLDRAKEVFAPYLETADLLLPTAEEAHALTGVKDDDTAAHLLLEDRDRVVALKRGSAGCTLYTRSKRVDAPGFVVEEVDPTGAGDCFNAACMLGLEAGWPLDLVASFATAAGALAVTRQGPMEGAPTRKEIEALLQN